MVGVDLEFVMNKLKTFAENFNYAFIVLQHKKQKTDLQVKCITNTQWCF